MKEFKYVIQDELGIHARPAGQMVKVAKAYSSKITVSVNGKSVEATKLMGLMGLGIQVGAEIHIQVEGSDETEACEAMEKFLKETL